MWSNSEGNVAVEFALTAPIFILMLVGLADYGLAARDRAALDAAARAGLQVLVKQPTHTSEAQTIATSIAAGAAAAAAIACKCPDETVVSCAGTCSGKAPRQFASVSVTKSHSLMFPWPGFSSPMALAAVAKGRVK